MGEKFTELYDINPSDINLHRLSEIFINNFDLENRTIKIF